MHVTFLLEALKEAKRGRGYCSPNPAVGAVAVKDNQIIASAWHQGAGSPHAEQRLLSQMPSHLSDVTLYVTLEPCNHWGKTPPCVDAIVNYGINRVVYAYKDTNPVVRANDTPAYLSRHDIEVIHHPVDEINTFYNSYRHWTLTGAPWVTAKLAQSLDGKIAGKGGKRLQITNQTCAQFTHEQRHTCDVILTTASTILHDDPMLNVRLKGAEQSKPVAIIDRQLLVHPSAKVFQYAGPCHIFYDATISLPQPIENCTYHPINCDDERLNLQSVIKKLGELGYHDVWVEAGPALFNALHQEHFVNQTFIYIAPILLGPEATSGYPLPFVPLKPDSIQWHPMDDNMLLSMLWANDQLERVCLQG